LCGLARLVLVKFMHCALVKHIWEKLQKNYEGDDKVKREKLKIHRGQFKTLKMNEEEDIGTYFLRVDEIVSTIRGLGEEMDETIIVQKMLRTLPSRFNPKIYAIEELKDLKMLTMDELHRILIAYEMRIEQDKTTKKEVTFKVSVVARDFSWLQKRNSWHIFK